MPAQRPNLPVVQSVEDNLMSAQHPGFQAEQANIAQKEGIPMENAGAILGAASRNASAAAKRANPRLNKVKGAPPKK